MSEETGLPAINLDHRYLIRRQADRAFVSSTNDLGALLPDGFTMVDTLDEDGLGSKRGHKGIAAFIRHFQERPA